MQARRLDTVQATACVRVALEHEWCNLTIAARAHVQTVVRSARVKAKASACATVALCVAICASCQQHQPVLMLYQYGEA